LKLEKKSVQHLSAAEAVIIANLLPINSTYSLPVKVAIFTPLTLIWVITKYGVKTRCVVALVVNKYKKKK